MGQSGGFPSNRGGLGGDDRRGLTLAPAAASPSEGGFEGGGGEAGGRFGASVQEDVWVGEVGEVFEAAGFLGIGGDDPGVIAQVVQEGFEVLDRGAEACEDVGADLGENGGSEPFEGTASALEEERLAPSMSILMKSTEASWFSSTY